MQRNRLTAVLGLGGCLLISSPARAQKAAPGINGKTACSLLTSTDIQRVTGMKGAARQPGKPEEGDFRSSCLHFGAVDIAISLGWGSATKVMFGRMRDNYAKAPARLGYKVEPIAGLGDDAYSLAYSGKMEARVLSGET